LPIRFSRWCFCLVSSTRTIAARAPNEPEALTLAASLFSDRHNEQGFFTRAPREIFAHLLTYRPTPQDLADWLSHDEEIDSRVRGTEMASVIAPTAPGQREEVMAELKMVGKALKLLPIETVPMALQKLQIAANFPH
jgi:hypothetical protein